MISRSYYKNYWNQGKCNFPTCIQGVQLAADTNMEMVTTFYTKLACRRSFPIGFVGRYGRFMRYYQTCK